VDESDEMKHHREFRLSWPNGVVITVRLDQACGFLRAALSVPVGADEKEACARVRAANWRTTAHAATDTVFYVGRRG
jgi:hypothetical protein